MTSNFENIDYIMTGDVDQHHSTMDIFITCSIDRGKWASYYRLQILKNSSPER